MNTLVDLLRGHAQARPQHTALTFLENGEEVTRRLDYAELDRRARSIAPQLGEPGERALLLYPSGPDFVTAFLGCLYAGVIAVPAYPPRSDKHLGRLRAIVADAQASLVLAPGDLDFPGTRVIATDRLPDNADAWRRPDLPDVAFLQYTSGSTGDPKGVVLTHANLLGNAKLLAAATEHSDEPKFVSWLPLFHDMGLIAKLLQAFHWGAECVVMPPAAFLREPIRWLRAITEHGGTVSGAPNFAYDLCVRRTTPEQREGLDLSSWRIAYNAAEPVRAETLRSFEETFGPYGFRPDTAFPCYGLAENSVFVSGTRGPVVSTVDRNALEHHEVRPGDHPLVGCGKESGDQRIRIVSPHSGQVLGPDAVGEVWTTGSSTGAGYWQRPEQSLATFGNVLPGEPGTWLRTGDLGFLDGEGELFLTGRMKDLIIQHGRNLYPQDLERTAEQAHPGLRPGCGAAFTVGDDEEKLVIVQEVTDDEVEVGAEVAAALAAEHDVSLHELVLIRTRSIPKTSSGKIARRACRQAYLDDVLDVVGRWRPIFDEVIAAVTERLGRGIAPGQAFASAGVDSVTAVAISGDLQRITGRQLPATLLFDHPTPEAVARFLSGDTARPSAGAQGSDEPIAVIGLGCRFPGAPSPEMFWNLLDRGGEAIDERDGQRGGFLGSLDQVAGFDAEFFGIAPSEAAGMDPQQRLVLEVAWEALEHAGIAPTSLAGTRTGVFVGISNNDYARLLGDRLDAHYGTGNALSIAANRLSYLLDLRGPSIAVDTACSSSLVAVHQACASLRRGESRVALAGGVNLVLAPHLSTVFTQARMLSPEGRCKTFSADADGYVRSEGCGVVVLKPLSTALADGDTVLAVIRGSAVNQDGRSNGLTAPNGPAQRAVITDALADAGVRPVEVGYVEAHGTGTPLGDPIEYGALADVLRGNEGCLLGSVKTNIGHLESAAGIAGLIKVVLALHHDRIPAHRNLGVLNPHLDAVGSPLTIPTTSSEWPRKIAGISSFGFGGTNAHVVVAAAPENKVEPSSHDRYVLALSAHTDAALHELALLFADRLGEGDLNAADVCATANTGRAVQPNRLAVAGADTGELAAALSDFLMGRHAAPADDLATAWLAGVAVRWPYRGRKVPLPTTPFQRTRLWLPDKAVAAPSSGMISLPGQHVWQREVAPGEVRVFDDHRVQGQVVVPGVSYVEMALTAAQELTGERHRVEDVEFRAVLALTGPRTIQVAIDTELRFTVHSGPDWVLHATGRLTPAPTPVDGPIEPRGRPVDPAEYYETMSRSVEYGPSMRCVRQAWVADGEAFASLVPSGLEPLLDSGFQLLGLLMNGTSLVLPVGIDRVDVARTPNGAVLAHATADGTVRWSDADGVFASAQGMRLHVVEQTVSTSKIEWLDRLSPDDRVSVVGERLREGLAGVLEADPKGIDEHRPMTDLGLDSLMSMDLLGDLKRELGVDVPAVQVLSGASLAELTETVLASLAEIVGDQEREEFVL